MTTREHFIQTYAASFLAALAAEKYMLLSESAMAAQATGQPVRDAYTYAEAAYDSYVHHHKHIG
jgi:hypothetical protein